MTRDRRTTPGEWPRISIASALVGAAISVISRLAEEEGM
jgi:hypothetical protein